MMHFSTLTALTSLCLAWYTNIIPSEDDRYRREKGHSFDESSDFQSDH